MHKVLYGRFPYLVMDVRRFKMLNREDRLRQVTFYVPEEN